MVQSGAPLYALQEVANPLQNGHLLADPLLGPEMGGAEHEEEAATSQQNEWPRNIDDAPIGAQ